MRFQYTAFAAATLLAAQVSAHSWVWCTDYAVEDPLAAPMGPDETDEARRNYDADLCTGYSPNYPTFFDALQDSNFGLDSGYENRPQFTSGDPNSQLCLSRPNTYTDTLPMAEYNSGETVCIAYPAKNHVAALTTNQFIPDAGNAVYMAPFGSAVTDTNFPATSSFVPDGLLEDFNGEHTNGQIDYLGYQNCPNFDAGNDRALCTMCFTLPSDLQTGEYYFAWHWEFNVGEHYSTCWSAQVDGSAAVETTTEVTTTEAEVVETEAPTEGDAIEEEDIQLVIVYNIQFSGVSSFDVLELSLQIEIGALLGVDPSRLSFEFEEDDAGEVVATLTISGASNTAEISALSMADSLTSLMSSDDLHDSGIMSNMLSITCLNCDDVAAADSAAGSVAPSLAMVAAAAVASFAL